MMMMKTFFATIICSLMCAFGLLAQSIVLIPDPDLIPSASTCTSIDASTTISFTRSSSMCGAPVKIVNEVGVVMASFDEEEFSYTFTEIGIHSLLCNAPTGSTTPEVFTFAICFSVDPEMVPTLSQWGVMICGLLFVIFGVVTIKNESSYSLDV